MFEKWVLRRCASAVCLAWAAALALGVAAGAAAAAPLKVVDSFSVLGDMVSEIGGDHIELATIVGPGGDVHAFEPTPQDVRTLAQARLLVVNGLGFEGWLPRLLAASGFAGRQVVASKGVAPRVLTQDEQDTHVSPGHDAGAAHDQTHRHVHAGVVDPHAWQSLANGMIYARNIADGLAKADPANAADYQSRAQRYIQQMKKLDAEVRQALGAIPAERRKVITSHDSLGYFGRDYGLRFISLMGISSEAEPSARDVAVIVDQIRKQDKAAVFLEGAVSPRLVRQIARETGAQVGGTLYTDALGAPDQPAGTYLGMFKWNAGQLIYALKP